MSLGSTSWIATRKNKTSGHARAALVHLPPEQRERVDACGALVDHVEALVAVQLRDDRPERPLELTRLALDAVADDEAQLVGLLLHLPSPVGARRSLPLVGQAAEKSQKVSSDE